MFFIVHEKSLNVKCKATLLQITELKDCCKSRDVILANQMARLNSIQLEQLQFENA